MEKKRLKLDTEYFDNYSDVTIHEDMLQDRIRTDTYRQAILKNYKLFYKKTVMDVGAGTGILSLFCVQAGAKKVYAVEASDMAEQTRKIVKENKMEDKIEVINSRVEDVELIEKVDIIVSEWMGYCLLYESMLESVLYARDQFLKKDGVMFPQTAMLYLAPISDEDYRQRLCIWDDIEDMYKVSMQSMKPYAKQCINRNVQIVCVPQEAIQAHGCQVFKADLKTVSLEKIQNVKCDFKFNCFGHSTINGLMTWFTVEFPQSILLSTSPYEQPTHWAQCVFHINQCMDVKQDSCITGSISIQPNILKKRFLDIVLTYKLNDEKECIQNMIMDDNLI